MRISLILHIAAVACLSPQLTDLKSSNEIIHPDYSSFLSEPDLPSLSHNASACFDVPSVPRKDQCVFAQRHCTDNIGVINLLSFYYCRSRWLTVPTIALAMLVCFVSLALTASDFLCPNLYSIAKMLNLSDNIAGLTLLALGNGSADVVSTFKALEVGATGLAISELVGAAIFILTVVVGAISIASPFKVPKHHFYRDISFYFVVTSALLGCLVTGSFNYLNGSLLFATYVAYVLVVIYVHSFFLQKMIQTSNIARLRSDYANSNDEDSSLEHYAEHLVSHPTIDILSALEEPESTEELDYFLRTHNAPQEGLAPLEAGSYGLKLLIRGLSKHSIHSDISPTPTSVALRNERPLTAETPVEPQVTNETAVQSVSEEPETGLWAHILPQLGANSPFPAKALHYVSLPMHIVLRLTTPNREQALEYLQSISSNAFTFGADDEDTTSFEGYDYAGDMKLLRVQVVCAMFFVYLVVLRESLDTWISLPFVGVVCAVSSYLIPTNDPKLGISAWNHRLWNTIGSLLGFVLSLLWISSFATEIVSILKSVAVILIIGDEIIGSTVFALGNSVGDLISNLTISRMGLPIMAFGACFGGPLLTICSLGLSSVIVIYNTGGHSIPIKFSAALKLNVAVLIFTLVFLSVFIPRNNWMFDRKTGFSLLSIWVASVIATVILGVH